MSRSVLAGLLTGFAALVLVLAGFITGVLPENLRTSAIVVSFLFLLAGFARGAAGNPWIKGVLVALGADGPVCVMAATGIAFTSKPHLVVFLAASLLASMAGAHARTLWNLARPQAGLAVGLAWLAFSVAAAQLWIPAILESMSAEHMKRAAPPFSFTTLDGAKISNQSIHGRVAVLAFWATWCTPCREELPRLNAIYQRYAGDSSVAFLAVDSEGEGSDFESSAAKAKAFFSKRNLSMPIAVDTDSRARLGVHGLPSLLIIDRGGNIRLLHTGYDGSERLERMIGEQIATLVSSPTE